MGYLRTFLALSVFAWHLSGPGRLPQPFVVGTVAVALFFVLSGFLMALVINEKYAPSGAGWQWRFYAARLARLMPIYLIIMVAAAISAQALGVRNPLSVELPPVEWLVVAATNIGILGQDLLPMAGPPLKDPALRLVPIAWTLAIEMQFYLAAPFLVRRGLWPCLAMLAALLAIRFACPPVALEWRYTFAPAMWCFFMLGAVGYWASAGVSIALRRRLGWPAVAVMCAAIALSGANDAWRDMDQPELWAMFAVFALCLPYIAPMGARFERFDSLIGDFCYPLYLVHLLVINTVNVATNKGMLPAWWPAWFGTVSGILLLAFVASAALLAIERALAARQRVARSNAAMPQMPAAAPVLVPAE